MGIETFDRAIAAGAVLLKAEIEPVPRTSEAVAALVLTFDVGRVLVRSDPRQEELVIESVASPGEQPKQLDDAAEEEPWWRLLGSPLTRAWRVPNELPATLCLQFRSDDENPRVVRLEARGEVLLVRQP